MKRVLLKLSGEALAGEKKTGFDEATVIEVAKQIRTIAEEGLEIGIVIGGGNFWRGRTSETIDRNKADQIGMLATVMNCIYVSDICRYLGLKTEIFTPFVCGAFTSLYSKDAVEASFAQGKIVFFAGGTGHPYFSTDTATVLRAVEIEAEAILLAKAVDGIYDSDPKTNPNAVKYDEISIEEVVAKKLAYSKKYDAVICVGAVIRGDTSHYDYVCNEVSKGVAQVGLETGVPVLFGIVTTENIEQAIARAGSKAGNKGYDCAVSAIEMINLIKEIEN